MNSGLKLFRWIPVCLILLFGCNAVSSCEAASREASTGECSPSRGCENRRFIEAVRAKCGGHTVCTIALDEVFKGIRRVYFVEKLSARLESCRAFRVSQEIARTYSPVCQYVLLDGADGVQGFLRGACLSEVEVKADRVVFEPPGTENVSVVAAGARLRVTVTRDPGAKEEDTVYTLTLSTAKPSPVRDDCIGLP